MPSQKFESITLPAFTTLRQKKETRMIINLYKAKPLIIQLCLILIIPVVLCITPAFVHNDTYCIGLINNEKQAIIQLTCSDKISTSDNISPSLETEKKIETSNKNKIDQKNNDPSDYLFRSIIDQASNLYQVDSALIQAIIMAESSYNPAAISNKGAMGLMQLMPATAKALGVEDCFNPKHNIHGGVKYFKQLLNQFNGNIHLALAAYNAGGRNVRRYKGVPPFKATKLYIKKVDKYYKYFKKQNTKFQTT